MIILRMIENNGDLIFGICRTFYLYIFYEHYPLIKTQWILNLSPSLTQNFSIIDFNIIFNKKNILIRLLFNLEYIIKDINNRMMNHDYYKIYRNC